MLSEWFVTLPESAYICLLLAFITSAFFPGGITTDSIVDCNRRQQYFFRFHKLHEWHFMYVYILRLINITKVHFVFVQHVFNLMLSFVPLSICVIDSRAVYRHLYAKIHIYTTNMQARLVYLQRIVRLRGKVDITEGRCRWDRCMWNLLSRRTRFVALACCCTTHVVCCCN